MEMFFCIHHEQTSQSISESASTSHPFSQIKDSSRHLRTENALHKSCYQAASKNNMIIRARKSSCGKGQPDRTNVDLNNASGSIPCICLCPWIHLTPECMLSQLPKSENSCAEAVTRAPPCTCTCTCLRQLMLPCMDYGKVMAVTSVSLRVGSSGVPARGRMCARRAARGGRVTMGYGIRVSFKEWWLCHEASTRKVKLVIEGLSAG